MIKDEIAAKFHLPPIEEYSFPAEDYYHSFLIQSDYVILKEMEAVLAGKKSGTEDIGDIISAREYARQMLNEPSEEK